MQDVVQLSGGMLLNFRSSLISKLVRHVGSKKTCDEIVLVASGSTRTNMATKKQGTAWSVS